MNEKLFVVGKYDKEGNLVEFMRAGRPWTVRVYSSITKAKHGISQWKRDSERFGYTLKILEITTLEEVDHD